MGTSRNVSPKSFNTVRRSHREERIRRQKLSRMVLQAICGVLLLLLLVSIVFLFFYVANRTGENQTVRIENSETFVGVLSGTQATDADLTVLRSEEKDSFFTEESVRLRKKAAEELAVFLNDFAKEHGIGLCVVQGYTEGNDILCTGYGVKLTGKSQALDDQILSELSRYGASYGWIAEKDKSGTFTGIFRYVGVPHAAYTAQKGWSFSKYLASLQELSDGSYFTVKTETNEYRIYYVRVSQQTGGSDTTAVELPKNCEYTVSGDRKFGLIVAATVTK